MECPLFPNLWLPGTPQCCLINTWSIVIGLTSSSNPLPRPPRMVQTLLWSSPQARTWISNMFEAIGQLYNKKLQTGSMMNYDVTITI
jgi:hypothetical protein